MKHPSLVLATLTRAILILSTSVTSLSQSVLVSVSDEAEAEDGLAPKHAHGEAEIQFGLYEEMYRFTCDLILCMSW